MSFIEKRPDSELIELLWQNGHVDFNNQTNCQALRTIFESQRTQKPESLLKCGSFLANSSDRYKDDGTSWFQGTSNNSVDKEFSDIFYEMPTSEPGRTDKANKEDNPYPPNFSLDESNIIKISKPGTTDFGITSSNFGEEISSCTTRTILSSVCGTTTETSDYQPGYAHNLFRANINKTVIASSSRGSGFSFLSTAQEITTSHGYKRKERNVRKSEGYSEEDENESSEESRRVQKLESGRRSRAAEVHNLSERRRRDKINEKMKELQDLIPHSNKIDKVSVLDEAIEYLKSLQLQLQSMWMRSGMVPMLYPSIHHQMSCTDTGMNRHPITSTRSANQLPKVLPDDIFMPGTSIVNQTPFCPPQDPNSIDFATQMQNCHLPGQYSSYHGFLRTQVPQVMNMCNYGPQMK